MEKEWMRGLDPGSKDRFRAIRYMDDLLYLTAKGPHFDDVKFRRDLHRSECYWKPLRLEDGGAGTFLETSFDISKNGEVAHWLKNTNPPGREPKVWRYAHYYSYTPWKAKQAVLTATLKKVNKMASDESRLVESAIWKLMEFVRLCYPIAALKRACSAVAVTTRNPAWFRVRHTLANYTAYRLG